MQTTFSPSSSWPSNPRPGTATPRPYQQQAREKIISDYESGKSRKQLVVLATGLGKGIAMGAVADYFLKKEKPVLILAHREELLEQVANEVSLVAGNSYDIQLEKAEHHADTSAHVVMASVQSIGRENNSRILKFPKDHFGLICIDEAHHSTGDTYQHVIKYFTESSNTLLVGVTATPSRSGKEESLSDIFDSIAINLDIVAGTKQNFLCPIVSWRVSSETDLSQIRTTAGDFNLKDLGNTVNNKERNTLIAETYTKRFPDKQALIFTVNVDHAYAIAEEFNSIGIKSAAVSAMTSTSERKQIVSDFKAGKIKVVSNMGVFTEGFNMPNLELIIQARPTKSQLLCTQMAGRVSRLFEGKEVGHFVEIVDEHSEKTATAAAIFGFKQSFDCEGHHFLECIQKAESLISKKDFFNPYNCGSWSEMLIRFERAEISNPKGFDATEFSVVEREIKDKELLYSEFNPNYEFYDSRYRYFYHGQNLKLLHTDRDEGFRYQIIAIPNALGGYDVTMAKKALDVPKYEAAERVVSYRGASAQDAIKKMEDYILNHYPEWDRLLWLGAPWKKRASIEPCSDKQYFLIAKNKLSQLPKEKISKHQASDIISAFFSKNS